MRLLVLYQARDSAADQPGYYDGFERLVREGALSGHAAIPFYGVSARKGWDGLWAEAAQTAQTLEADAVFLQFFHGPIPDPTQGIQRLKGLPNKPTIFTSLGDPFGRWTNRVPKCFRIASALADVTFLTGMGYLAQQLAQDGCKNLVLMPHGCCQVRFGLPLEDASPDFDVTFIGSRIISRNPFSHFFDVGRGRTRFVKAFSKRYGRRFGLFGHGWNGVSSWQGPVSFSQQCQTYRRSAVVLGGTPNGDCDYYMSDRPFIAAASGVPLVDYSVPGVDRILEAGRDWWLANDIEGMMRCCDRLLAMPESDRAALGGETRQGILARHTQYHRCREMVDIVRSVRQSRLEGRSAETPRLSFLNRNDSDGHAPDAVVAWNG